MLAERLGGQTMDTMSIENFISVLETDGPKFAAALEQHAKQYDVEILNLQLAEKLIPATEKNGLICVQLANGATLKSKTVILSTGARWREVNVPGEKEYRNKGVAYCPHCDGPLFRGKRVAVIGGGNSGVEAAIGVFVQIGLVPNSEWLKGTLELSRHGEIVVDNRGQTSLPGVFAAGDVTTVPFKQIIIATGDGAKAALGAFDHLIRSSAPEPVAA